jgi:radical SAM protein with 4Fe4S-binding SPASM domain
MEREYYAAGKVHTLQIESTQRCPQSCKYCYAGSKDDSAHGLSSDQIVRVLHTAADLAVRVIGWFGGDPLMRPDWFELCVKARSLGLINEIWSSGIPLADPDVAKRAVEVTAGGVISTHLDSLDPRKIELLQDSGTNGAHAARIESILRGVENCIAAGKSPDEMSNCITLTAPLGEEDVERTMTYFQRAYGIKTCLTLFNPVAVPEDIKLWEPSRRQVIRTCQARLRIHGLSESSSGGMDLSKFFCGTVVCVAYDGWVLPCSVIRTTEFGNIRDEPFATLLERGRRRLLYLDFRDPERLPKKCARCAHNDECFGCRSNAFYYAGNLMAEDPKCFGYKRKGGARDQGRL